MPHQWLSYLSWLALITVSAISVYKGASAERIGAVLILSSNIAGDLAFIATAPRIPQFILFYLDLALSVGLLVIAFLFSSLWIGAAMLLQSIILFIHALALGDDGLSSLGFVVANNVVSWLMYACLLGATLMSWCAKPKPLR